MARTMPGTGASSGTSIFIASSSSSVCPAATAWPTMTSMPITEPCTGERKALRDVPIQFLRRNAPRALQVRAFSSLSRHGCGGARPIP